MGRRPSTRSGKIARNCDQIALNNNEIRRLNYQNGRLRDENIRLEWLCHTERTGDIIDLATYRAAILYPRCTHRPQPPRMAA